MPAILPTVDLSRLPAPEVIARPGYDTIRAELIADLVAALPTFDATVASDPVIKLLEVAAWRELLLRQQVTDAAHQVMPAYATGANLDQLAALIGVPRLADEADDSLRRRLVLGPAGFSVAGPGSAYVYHALSASPNVLDASASSPAPGEVRVAVLSRLGTGAASAALVAAVRDVLSADGVRPLTDQVTVVSAEIVPFEVRASLTIAAGPDTALVHQAALARLDAYLTDARKLGRDITRSSIFAALTAEGVRRVDLALPAADVTANVLQAAHCTAIAVTVAGVDG